MIDALYELLDADEGSSANDLVGDQRKEALDLDERGTVGRDEMHARAWSSRQPDLDLRVAVCGVVVGDAVNVRLVRHGPVDRAQKLQGLLVPVARLASSQHRSVEHIQCGGQRGRAGAFVVVGDALDMTEPHGRDRLGSLQSLARDLLVHAEDPGVVGRAHIQPDRVAQLLDEKMIVGQLEAFGAVRRQAEGREVPGNAGLGHAGLGGHRTYTPVRRTVGRFGVQRGLDQFRQASSLIVRGLPGRTSSYRPARRRLMKRARYLPAVALVSFSRSAIVLLASLAALLRMMRAVAQYRPKSSDCVQRTEAAIAPRPTAAVRPLVCPFSSRYLRFQDTALAGKASASY